MTHTLSKETPQWGDGCGFHQLIEADYDPNSAAISFRVQAIQMSAGIGTHMDAPSHCIPNAANIDDIPLQSLIVPCAVIDVSAKAHECYQLSADDITSFEITHGNITKGMFVVVYTGWDQWWNQPEKYRNNLVFPSVSAQAAHILLERDIAGLGIDTLSPDTADSGFPVHKLLLGAGKYIVENVANAKQLCPFGYIMVMPIKIQGGTEAPIRLVGVTNTA